MSAPLEPAALARIVRDLDPTARPLRAWPLTGGVSAQTVAFEFERRDGRRETRVLRRHGPRDLARNPDVAADEFRLLEIVRSRGVPAPAPLRLDASGAVLPTPFLILEHVEGTTEPGPAARAGAPEVVAAQLAAIHAIGDAPELAFVPERGAFLGWWLEHPPARLDETIGEGAIRAALAPRWPPPQRNPSALLHGDFWPGNLLWRRGRLVAVLDWEDAARGDPLADLGVARLDLLWAWGEAATARFSARYLELSGVDATELPLWDLVAALRPAHQLSDWAPDAAAEARMRERHARFTGAALARLGG